MSIVTAAKVSLKYSHFLPYRCLILDLLECARAARASRKGSRGFMDSDEDSWPEDTPASKKPQRNAYDDDDDDGWGAVQSPLPQQTQVNPGISKAYSCCGCTITVPSGSPPVECPICKLAEVKKELEAEKSKPPVVIRMNLFCSHRVFTPADPFRNRYSAITSSTSASGPRTCTTSSTSASPST